MFMLMNTKYLKQLQDNQLEDLIENWNSKNGNYLSKTPYIQEAKTNQTEIKKDLN